MSFDEPRSPFPGSPGPPGAGPSRRDFLRLSLLAGLGLTAGLGGCAQPKTTADLPGPEWPDQGDPWLAAATPQAPPPPTAARAVPATIGRGTWAAGAPVATRMSPMLPVRYITVHHSAGPLFSATDQATTADRLERIRRFHTVDRGWGDIGYHYAVDRAGRVWECRPLAWQGAHVRDHNEHNIGVMLLGDFDRQEPTQAQVAALTNHVSGLMTAFRVAPSRLKTHQEWAPTACPGRSVQRYMVSARASGRFG